MNTFTHILRIVIGYITSAIACRILVAVFASALIALFGPSLGTVVLIVMQLVLLFHPKTARLLALVREFFVYYILKAITFFKPAPIQAGPAYAR